MPLIYGEGPKAFLRLQEEIFRLFDNQTVFCWAWDPDEVSMVVRETDCFYDCIVTPRTCQNEE
ncbi:hypothetical protein CDEST_10631 [Colletotrichum destructivum]|uniref:Uncharacterized protein n=1 Tax=Colletotrichum destructivum TaxID=34406 RepID=A0AAX4IQX5_9PEZI|nr:hypothetical protein CDEST_10631 [Colletotrichum destructivum]